MVGFGPLSLIGDSRIGLVFRFVLDSDVDVLVVLVKCLSSGG